MKVLLPFLAIILSTNLFAGGGSGIKSIVGPAVQIDREKQIFIIDINQVKSINTMSVGIINAKDIQDNIDRINSAKIISNKLTISLLADEVLDIIE